MRDESHAMKYTDEDNANLAVRKHNEDEILTLVSRTITIRHWS